VISTVMAGRHRISQWQTAERALCGDPGHRRYRSYRLLCLLELRARLRSARRSALPTIAASGVAIADLDGDGWPDVIFANAQGDASFVYWGSPDGFASNRRLQLPTFNASAITAVDLNHDGHPDLVFANFNKGNSYDTDSYIYWGGPDGPEANRRQSLPTSGASAIVVADLQNTGKNDLIFINGLAATNYQPPSLLYLSDRRDPYVFSRQRSLDVDAQGCDSYAAADLDLSGFPDLLIPSADGLSIYWGGTRAFQRMSRTVVTPTTAQDVRVADVNRDGYLDLVLSEWGPAHPKSRFIMVVRPDSLRSIASRCRWRAVSTPRPWLTSTAMVGWISRFPMKIIKG